MPQLIDVAPVTDIQPGKPVCVKSGRDVIAVFNCNGRFLAINDMCPHAGAPLSQGYVDGTRVTCAWHGWSFEMDGAKCNGPDGMDRYPVVIENGIVKVEIRE